MGSIYYIPQITNVGSLAGTAFSSGWVLPASLNAQEVTFYNAIYGHGLLWADGITQSNGSLHDYYASSVQGMLYGVYLNGNGWSAGYHYKDGFLYSANYQRGIGGDLTPSGIRVMAASTNQVEGVYIDSYIQPLNILCLDPFNSAQELEDALNGGGTVPITYRLTNATTTGPSGARVGDTVTVPLAFPEGYGVVNPLSDAYVTCNGVAVPSTYSDGRLVFTMPDPFGSG